MEANVKKEHNKKNEKIFKGQNSVNKRKRQTDDACPYAKKCGGCDYQGPVFRI